MNARSNSKRWLGATIAIGAMSVAPCAAAEPLLRINDLQVLASHNSYKEPIDPALFALLLELRSPARIRPLEYGHRPLAEQLDAGLRALELDVYHDPQGGRYATPRGLAWLAERGIVGTPYDPEGEMKAPGFKVLHVQDLDFRSNCATLARCLGELRRWSDAHPRHLPIVVTMNAKDDKLAGIEGVVEPLPFDAAAYDALDGEILAVLPRERLIVPDDVRGARRTLREAVLANAWPTIDEARGRFLFVLDETDAKRDRYVANHPSLQRRVLFVNAPPESDEAAFLIMNEPISDGARIRELVAQGYLVRTRADADTREARSGETARREAAFASGAQVVSTDYYEPNPAFGTSYQVRLPGGGAARCNPARIAVASCRVEE